MKGKEIKTFSGFKLNSLGTKQRPFYHVKQLMVSQQNLGRLGIVTPKVPISHQNRGM